VRYEEGRTCVVAQGEVIPITCAFGGPLRRTAREDAFPDNIDRDSAPGDGTMSNVHTTYPRMGWSSSHSKLCGTRTVAVFKERVGRARPWEFGVRRARSGVPTLVSRRG